MEESINGDVGLIKAWKADPFGNLVFRGTARNFNPDCARAARYVIAEVCIACKMSHYIFRELGVLID